MTVVATPAPAATPQEEAVAAQAPRGARVRKVLSHVPVNVTLLVIGLLWFIPALGLLVTSFRQPGDYFVNGWWKAITSPSSLTFSNYQHTFQTGGIGHALFITALITVPVTILVCLLSALAGFALVFLNWPGRDWVFIFSVALLVVPLQMALIPVSTLYGHVGLFGTIQGVILFHVAFGLPFGIFLMRNFYTGIPKDLLEAARIDGAGEWMMFRRIVLPLGKPALASLAIFQFLWVWNDLLVALVFLGSSTNQPITVAIFSQLRQFGANIDLISTAAFISMVVPLIVFFAFQRQFVRGVLAGAVK